MMQKGSSEKMTANWRSFLLWLTTAALAYGFLSGLAIWLMPFGLFSQYSILVHSLIGGLTCVPVVWLIYLHWQKRRREISTLVRRVANSATVMALLCILTGILVSLQAAFGTWVWPSLQNGHLITGLLLGLLLTLHLVPVSVSGRQPDEKTDSTGDGRHIAVASVSILILLAFPQLLAWSTRAPAVFQAFGDDYDWEFGPDRPFWPSRIRISDPPWRTALDQSLKQTLDDATFERLETIIDAWPEADHGPISALSAAILSIEMSEATRLELERIFDEAVTNLADKGAIRAHTLTGSEGCGESGCHASIYREWATIRSPCSAARGTAAG
jgi:hypothetical protein